MFDFICGGGVDGDGMDFHIFLNSSLFENLSRKNQTGQINWNFIIISKFININ